MMRVAQDYIRRWRLERRPVRFDLIGIRLGDEGDSPQIEHIEGIL